MNIFIVLLLTFFGISMAFDIQIPYRRSIYERKHQHHSHSHENLNTEDSNEQGTGSNYRRRVTAYEGEFNDVKTEKYDVVKEDSDEGIHEHHHHQGRNLHRRLDLH